MFVTLERLSVAREERRERMVSHEKGNRLPMSIYYHRNRINNIIQFNSINFNLISN